MLNRKPIYHEKGRNLTVFFLIALAAISLSNSKPVFSQIGNTGEILKSGTEDAKILFQEYLKPFGSGFGADMNTGWFSSAKPLRPFGFDLQISASASFVPAIDRSFDVTDLNLNTVKLLSGPAETPTLFGDKKDTSVLGVSEFNTSTQQDQDVYSFRMPEGTGYHLVPAPMAQLSLGLPGHLQTTIRYSPNLVIDNDYNVRIFGIGGMIGLNQLLLNNRLPFDISLQAGYMNLNAGSKLNVLPPEGNSINNPFPDSHWEGQRISLKTNTFTANVIIGKNISFITLFGGVGLQDAITKISTEGPYPVVLPTPSNGTSSTYDVQSFTVPIDLSLEGSNRTHAIGGLQIRIGFLSLSGSYTYAEYSTIKAGLGIRIRS